MRTRAKMRLITWNCWGLGNGPAIRGLLDVQKREPPDILFLAETKRDGESRSDEKDNTWELLRILKKKYDMPWLCSGDFNEILFGCEKEGGPSRPEVCMQKFHSALEDSDLHDLGFVGDPFTWRNNHHVAAWFIKERLDRAVASSAWRGIFPLVKVTNGDPRHSDHRPIIIEVGSREGREWRWQMQVLPKFEARWLEEEDCAARVEEAWVKALSEGDNSLMEVQKRVLGELWEWDRNVLGELEKRISKVKKELEKCRRRNISQEVVKPGTYFAL
ncbi:hypothetical protein C2845_PM11G28210 [Panicum miliaceum]|uniref:Endonuclease/exonuclease/phosphatase domain-containing protein n=1 Tax=Panicum miliaceum TaxID=4540 RepID=A0A3L6RTC7_PANMI|nr:hypothetical protein C2845_PM11G28210 [Panicum miliaceum]